jgi:hypothetical protein
VPTGGVGERPSGHWLRPQASARIPRRIIYLDTEARFECRDGVQRQSWRLGVTGSIIWSEARKRWGPLRLRRHATPEELWAFVTGFTKPRARTVLVAHNLAYDLRISQALQILPALGWSMTRPTMTDRYTAFNWESKARRLTMADSHSLLPASAARIGALMGETKPPLPGPEDDEAAWWGRCEADVRLLAGAYLAILDWLAEGDLGGWARSGSGTGWAVLLHRHLSERVLVHGDPEVRSAERSAMYAGRAEAWRWGPQGPATLHLWDYQTAYGRVAAEVALPAIWCGYYSGVTWGHINSHRQGTAWLCWAEVAQDAPVLPTADSHGVYWPTGTFAGWYWDVELAAAIASGAQVRVRGAHRYRSSGWLQSWARWCLDVASRDATPEERVRALVAKHWTRSVIGRTAMRYADWQPWGEAWAPGVRYEPVLDMDTGLRGWCMTVGQERWEAWSLTWWRDALPQVLSAVMAHCRVRLWAAMTTAGLPSVAYVNTDSLLVDAAGHRRLSEATAAGRLASLRYLGPQRNLDILAPQQVEGNGYRRLAGVPAGAVRLADLRYRGEVWEGFTTSLAHGHPGEVWVRQAEVRLSGADTRRVHLPAGRTRAYRTDDGTRAEPVTTSPRRPRSPG